MSLEGDLFPRGASTGVESKPRPGHVDRDDLFIGASSSKRKRSKHDTRRPKLDLEQQKKKRTKSVTGDDNQEKLYRRLNKQNLTENVLVCGCIENVSAYELRVSLPHQNIGYVPLTMISDEYTELVQRKMSSTMNGDEEVLSQLDDLFQVGQYLICRIIESASTTEAEAKTGRRKLHLSINPKDICEQMSADSIVKGMLLPGVVSSIVDHGYIVNIGFSQRKGFLAKGKKNLTSEALKIGFYALFQVKESTSSTNSRIIPLKMVNNVKKRPALSPTKLPFHMLLPGLKCKVTIAKTRVNGLEVSFGEIKGFLHTQDFETLSVSLESFSAEQELEAMVLSIDPSTKLVHFSMQPHLLALNESPSIISSAPSSPLIGSVQTCSVLRNIGTSLAIRLSSLNQNGLILANHLTDEKDVDFQEILSTFKSGQKIQCRIIGISLSSNLAICSLKKSIIEAPFITYSDIDIGSIVKGSINHVDENGLIINLSKYIKGFVPILQNADIPIKETLNKFVLQKKVQCRVLQVDPARQRLILTMKKSLINSKLPIVSSYNDLNSNIITIGVIIAIQDYGLLVKLFGDLCGLVPKSEIGQLQSWSSGSFKSQLQQMFYIGQTVSCRIVNSDAEQRKITLSLKVPGKMTFGSKLAQVPSDFAICQVINWTVTEYEGDEHLIGNVTLPPLERRRPISVTLTRVHTSDFVEHQSLIMRFDCQSPTEESKERDGIYWSHLSYINISTKKILIDFCRRSTLPQKFEECTVGLIVPGVVQNIFEYGLFIDLPNTIVAFAPHKHLDLNGTLETAEKKYRIGQTVLVRILQLDEEKHRCIVTLKSLIYDGEIAQLNQADYILRHYLDEKYQLIEAMKNHGTGPLSNFLQENEQWLGMQVRCVLEKRVDDWFTGRLENGLPASLPYDAHYSIGDSIDSRIIDFHLPAQQFIVTLDLKRSIISTNTPPSLTQCTVLCQLPLYALAITEETNHLVHIPTFAGLNSFYSSSPSITYKRKQLVDLSSITPYISETYQYLTVPTPSKKVSIQVHQLNELVPVTVCNVLSKQINVQLSDGSRGRIHITELVDNPSPETFRPLDEQFQVDQKLQARVIGTRNIEQNVRHHRPVYEFSLRSKSSSIENFEIGDRVTGFLESIDEKNNGLWFLLSLHLRAFVPQQFMFIEKELLRLGQCYRLTVINKSVNDKGTHYTLSLNDSRTESSSTVYAKFKEIISPNEFHFTIDEQRTGVLLATDVSDAFGDFVYWTQLMNVRSPLISGGQLNLKKELWKFRNKTVRAYVKSEDPSTERVILSTRKSRVNKNHLDVVDEEIDSIDQISSGDVLHGYIDVLTNRQMTLLLGGGRSVLGQIEKVVNRTLNGHLREFLDVGMVVEASVIAVNKETNKCQMRLTDAFIEQLVAKRFKRANLSRTNSLNGSIVGDDDESNAKRFKLDDESSKTEALGGDFTLDWNADLSTLRQTDAAEEEDEMDESTSSLLKTKKNQRSTSSNHNERTQEQFEELVKQAPNDSQLWIEYMQFYIDQAEIDRARALAERALNNIYYREERDKLNIWIAYLNLENRHGTPDKLNTILTRALGNCDGLTIYQRLAYDVYEKNEQFEDANATLSLMTRKFSKSKQAWLAHINYLFRRHQTDQAKTVLDKSFLSLPSTDHIDMINKFSQLEFKYGDKERAKTLYEKLLANYPKRIDLWSIYIDMLIKYDSDPLVATRAIFDRVLSSNIPPKKMKVLIKKYLDFERQNGSTADINRVKERVLQYVNNTNDSTVDKKSDDFQFDL